MKKSDYSQHEFAIVVFLDPAFGSGWTTREDVPQKKELIHVGCGMIIREDDNSITLASFEGLYDDNKEECVLNPLTIHKDLMIIYDKFSWEDYYERGRKLRGSTKIHKCIELKIKDFC